MSRRNHYHVYVIELSKDVLYEGRFKRCNPGYITGKPCVYVGMTGLDPRPAFRQAQGRHPVQPLRERIRLAVITRPVRRLQPDELR